MAYYSHLFVVKSDPTKRPKINGKEAGVMDHFHFTKRPGLVVLRGDSCSKGRRFESQHRVLDGQFSHLFVVKIELIV